MTLDLRRWRRSFSSSLPGNTASGGVLQTTGDRPLFFREDDGHPGWTREMGVEEVLILPAGRHLNVTWIDSYRWYSPLHCTHAFNCHISIKREYSSWLDDRVVIRSVIPNMCGAKSFLTNIKHSKIFHSCCVFIHIYILLFIQIRFHYL